MHLGVIIQPTFNSKNHWKTRKFSIWECDSCHKIFRKKYESSRIFRSQTKSCSDKQCKISLKKTIQANRETTCLERLGVKNPFQSEEIKEKSKQTMLEKHGVDSSQKSSKIQQRTKQTCLTRFGVENPFQSEEIKEKSKQTCIERYGVEYPVQNLQIKLKIQNTNLEKHGVKCPFESPLIQQKCLETMRKNGTIGRRVSLDEEKFGNLLKTHFQCVISQKHVENWNIDFFISDINLYVQFDGVYWHGLNRQIDEIMQFKSSKDLAIFRTIQKDKEQNYFFEKENLKLIRVTDKEFSKRYSIKDFLQKLTDI